MAAATQPPINHNKNNKKDFDLTRAEVDRLEKALKDETFVKLLTDYARDLADPVKKAEYEREIAVLEQERGYDVSFVHPKPGYVIKVEEIGSKKKIFINICSEGQIGKPESVSTSQNGQTGLKWSIPYSLSKPRDDTDRSGSACVVFDAIFHPDTLYLASRDTRIKTLVHNTAFDALQSTFNVQVDASQIKYPKMKFKGVFHPTVIRKPRVDASGDDKADEFDDEHEMTDEHESETTLELLEKAVTTTPSYSIKYSSPKDLQDFLIQTTDVASSRPKQMIIEIELPKLDSAADLDLDVQESILSLVRDIPPVHKLNIQLPYPVDENNGNAKFDKSKKCLVITLPIKQAAPVMKSARHSSNDSGIEMEEAALASPVVANDNSENVVDKQSDNINMVEGYRTAGNESVINSEKSSNKSVKKCDKKKKGKSGRGNKSEATVDTTTAADITSAVNDLQLHDDERIHDHGNSDKLDNVVQTIVDSDENTGIVNIDASTDLKTITNPNMINEYRTKVGFLDSEVSYQLPVFTHTVFDNVMIVTLEVKNVSEESIAHVCFDKWKSVHFKFTSIGSGYFPVHHAFYIDFLQVGSFEEDDINIECWDNNVVLQFPWQKHMKLFRVGVSACELNDKEYTVQQSASLELATKSDDENKRSSVKKYAKEIHPKFNSPEKQKKESNEKCKDSLPASENNSPTINSKAFTNIRERHASGESIDSLSMSPYDTVLLEEQHIKHLEELEEKETAGESDADDPRLLQRSQSTEEGMLSKQNIYKPRSILKRKNMPNLVGSRFRCYSESNVSEMGSMGQLSLGISEPSISEEGETVIKKSVRFKEKAEKRLYRIGSSIIPSNKVLKRRKYQKERRRRLSEGDSVELQPASNSMSKPPLQSSGSLDSNTWEQESNDDSGLSSSLEEAMVVGPGGDNLEQAGAGLQQDTANQKSKKKTKKRTKTFEMASDLIFDLDI